MIAKELQTLIHQLEITTRKQVSGPLLGDAISSLKGSGFEFNQLREYIQGDDIRFIDWKASARANKTLVRQYLEDRNRSIMLAVDVSASMGYGKKGDFVRQLGAVLAFVGLHAKDSVGLIMFSDDLEKIIPPRHSRNHTLQLVSTLLSYEPQHKKTNLAVPFEYLSRLRGQRSVVFMLSDFMGELTESMMRVAAQRHDLMGIRCLDSREKEFPSAGTLIVEDRETGKRVTLTTGKGSRVSAAMKSWHESQRETLVRSRVDLLDLEVGKPFTGDVLTFLRQRMIGR